MVQIQQSLRQRYPHSSAHLAKRGVLVDIQLCFQYFQTYNSCILITNTVTKHTKNTQTMLLTPQKNTLQIQQLPCKNTLKHTHTGTQTNTHTNTQPQTIKPTDRKDLGGAYLILQLHDELIYEVCNGDLEGVAALVRCGMEGGTQLKVKLPVKLKMGRNWGEMNEYG